MYNYFMKKHNPVNPHQYIKITHSSFPFCGNANKNSPCHPAITLTSGQMRLHCLLWHIVCKAGDIRNTPTVT